MFVNSKMIVLFISVYEFSPLAPASNKVYQPIVEHRWYHVVLTSRLLVVDSLGLLH